MHIKHKYIPLEDLRSEIRLRRKKLKITITKMAELTKSTNSNISNFELGKANITVDLLDKILTNLHLSLNCHIL